MDGHPYNCYQYFIPSGYLTPRFEDTSLSFQIVADFNRNKTRCTSLNKIGSYATLEQRRNKRLSDQAERPMPDKSFFS
jgi:hypothetical protein